MQAWGWALLPKGREQGQASSEWTGQVNGPCPSLPVVTIFAEEELGKPAPGKGSLGPGAVEAQAG